MDACRLPARRGGTRAEAAQAGSATGQRSGRGADRRGPRRGGGDRRPASEPARARLSAGPAPDRGRFRRLHRRHGRDRRAVGRCRTENHAPALSSGRESGRAEPRRRGLEGQDRRLFGVPNASWAPDALTKLVRNFGDSEVGYVCGRVRGLGEPDGTNREGVYWGFETWLRERECLAGSVTGGSRTIYAVRRSDYVDVDPRFGHDLDSPYLMVQRGRRAVYEPEARFFREALARSRGRVRAQGVRCRRARLADRPDQAGTCHGISRPHTSSSWSPIVSFVMRAALSTLRCFSPTCRSPPARPSTARCLPRRWPVLRSPPPVACACLCRSRARLLLRPRHLGGGRLVRPLSAFQVSRQYGRKPKAPGERRPSVLRRRQRPLRNNGAPPRAGPEHPRAAVPPQSMFLIDTAVSPALGRVGGRRRGCAASPNGSGSIPECAAGAFAQGAASGASRPLACRGLPVCRRGALPRLCERGREEPLGDKTPAYLHHVDELLDDLAGRPIHRARAGRARRRALDRRAAFRPEQRLGGPRGAGLRESGAGQEAERRHPVRC